MFDATQIRKMFPIFAAQPELVYLDSAATALKPKSVIDAMNRYYFEYSTNISRGLYPLAEQATGMFDQSRRTIARFMNAECTESIVFTANATHAINLVALGLEHRITPKHNLVVTALEHHSNYLPWKEAAHRTGAEFRSTRFNAEGYVDPIHLASLVDKQTAIVALAAVSNVFGVINPVSTLIRTIRNINPHTLILIDACQAAGHLAIDMQAWDADFIVFSGHKLFGPTGIGVLAGKQDSLKQLTPMNVGGGTVLNALNPITEYKSLPENLEGGTPNIAGAIGLAAAIEYVETLGLENIHTHEVMLTKYALAALHDAFGETIHFLGTGNAEQRAGIISFTFDSLHPHDLAHLLGEAHICVRAGEHCASPLHLGATTRISLSIYNDTSDIDTLIKKLKEISVLFKR
jgi:cysteine desulfurase/selenocysteine lyase